MTEAAALTRVDPTEAEAVATALPPPPRPRSAAIWWSLVLVAVAGTLAALFGLDGGTRATYIVFSGVAVVAWTVQRALTASGSHVNVGLCLAWAWIGAVVLLALVAQWLPLEEPLAVPLSGEAFVAPDLRSSNPLGTDGLSRDYVSRLIYGARPSLLLGFGCAAISLFVGAIVGAVIGFLRGPFEVLNMLAAALLAFPPIVMLLALVSVLRPSLTTMFIALTVVTVPSFIRLARSAAIAEANKAHVVAARSYGSSEWRVLRREILPAVYAAMAPLFMVVAAVLIVSEASVSFLGLGIQPPSPSWGNMIGEVTTTFTSHPHALLIPSTALLLTILSCNQIGRSGSALRKPSRPIKKVA